MSMWKRGLGVAGVALAFAALAPVTTASAATSSAMESHWEIAARYYGMDMYNRCHRDGVRTGRGYRCVEFPVKWGDPYYELWILVY
ncbi:hypothetical protein [Nonomuraea sp. NPDC049758]|uniref:hypothetical protein n=1 Tax=Nonomuraea sp. NPDC049758 TaxID=3154360 RepID=UPI00343EEF58